MPAINVNPTRQDPSGPKAFPSKGRRNPPCGNRLRRFCGAKAPSPRGGAPLKADGGARRGGVIHARD